MIELQNVTLHQRVRNVSATLEGGEHHVVVGPNGAGKSTLLRLIGGIEKPSEGRILVNGKSPAGMHPKDRAALISWLPQRPLLAEGTTIGELMLAARYRFSEKAARARDVALGFLEKVSAPQTWNRDVGSLSGGELQRVLIAALLAQEAPIVLVDEPANHLDPLAEIQTYRLLRTLASEENRTLIVLSHNPRLALLSTGAAPAQVLGVREGHLNLNLPGDAPDLPDALGNLFDVKYLGWDTDAPLAVSLKGEPQ